MADIDRIEDFNAAIEAEAKELGLLPKDETEVTQLSEAKEIPSGNVSEKSEEKETIVPEREYTDLEKEQMALGWDPNKPDGVSAAEFKRVGEIIEAKRQASKKAAAANKEVEELTKTVKQLVEHNKKLEKASYEKALKELEETRRQRILEADIDAVEKLDLERQVIENAKAAVDKMEVPQVQTELSEDTKAYVERNSFWLNGTGPEEKKMQALTKNVINYLQEVEPNISEKAAIEAIESELRLKFPHKFQNDNKEKPAAVLSPSKTTSPKQGGLDSLSHDERRTFIAIQKVDPEFTLKEYLQQLELVGRRS